MDSRNETVLQACRFLSVDDFKPLYDAFIEAFSDYVFPFALTEAQFQNHITLNAVDLNRTVSYIESGRLLGFSLNGFGTWNGHSTVYDAGTGVVPSARRRGISRAMFEFMLPILRLEGMRQFLLEVITTNKGAVRLYEEFGFEPTRELALLQCDGAISTRWNIHAPDLRFQEITQPEWSHLNSFWDVQPSWQNSIPAIGRSEKHKKFIGAFVEDRCVGYIIFSNTFGRVAQLAVDKLYRNHGVGTALLVKMQEYTAPGYSLQIINADKTQPDIIAFFRKRGFYERINQYEMLKYL